MLRAHLNRVGGDLIARGRDINAEMVHSLAGLALELGTPAIACRGSPAVGFGVADSPATDAEPADEIGVVASSEGIGAMSLQQMPLS